jgi:hypothetical protein
MSDEKAGGQAKPQDYRRGNALDGRAARWVTKDVVYRQARANDGRDNRPSRERARAHVSEPRHDNGGDEYRHHQQRRESQSVSRWPRVRLEA